MLISVSGASLSVGVPGSLLVAFGDCGVSPAPYSHRSLRAFHSNQQLQKTTISFNIALVKTKKAMRGHLIALEHKIIVCICCKIALQDICVLTVRHLFNTEPER
jgi:hypothetical protein